VNPPPFLFLFPFSFSFYFSSRQESIILLPALFPWNVFTVDSRIGMISRRKREVRYFAKRSARRWKLVHDLRSTFLQPVILKASPDWGCLAPRPGSSPAPPRSAQDGSAMQPPSDRAVSWRNRFLWPIHGLKVPPRRTSRAPRGQEARPITKATTASGFSFSFFSCAVGQQACTEGFARANGTGPDPFFFLLAEGAGEG